MKTVFVSNTSFGGTVLKKFLEQFKPSVLITSPFKENKRGKVENLFIRNLARQNKIEVKEVTSKDDFHKVIETEKPDLVVFVAFGMIMPKETLNLSTFINIHPSLLPKYRGATPIQNAIIDNVEKSGVSIIKMDEKIDSGPIIKQDEVPFHPKITYTEAENILAEKGGDLLLDIFSSFGEKVDFSERKQNEEEATYTNPFCKEDGKINWEEPAKMIESKIRALNPWPGTYSKMGEKNFKILEAEIQEQTTAGPFGDPGKVYLGTNHTIAIQTGKDFLLIKKLQIEGKNSTTSKDYLQGNMHSIGITLS